MIGYFDSNTNSFIRVERRKKIPKGTSSHCHIQGIGSQPGLVHSIEVSKQSSLSSQCLLGNVFTTDRQVQLLGMPCRKIVKWTEHRYINVHNSLMGNGVQKECNDTDNHPQILLTNDESELNTVNHSSTKLKLEEINQSTHKNEIIHDFERARCSDMKDILKQVTTEMFARSKFSAKACFKLGIALNLTGPEKNDSVTVGPLIEISDDGRCVLKRPGLIDRTSDIEATFGIRCNDRFKTILNMELADVIRLEQIC